MAYEKCSERLSFLPLSTDRKKFSRDLERLAIDIIDTKLHPQHEDIRLAAVAALREITLNRINDPDLSKRLLNEALKHRVFAHTSSGLQWVFSSKLSIPQQRLERTKLEVIDKWNISERTWK